MGQTLHVSPLLRNGIFSANYDMRCEHPELCLFGEGMVGINQRGSPSGL